MYTYGWKRQEIDRRDWSYTVSHRSLAQLPRRVNLANDVGPYLNQGSLGSCGPNTAAEAIQFDQGLESLPVRTPSRLGIYWCARYLQGTVSEDSGVDNRSLMKALASYGFADESLWPYVVPRFRDKPGDLYFQAAASNRIRNYASVPQNLDQMRGCLAAGRPFIFGFDCYPQIESDEAAVTGMIRDPGFGETPIGGHDMLCVGYNDALQLFILRQHWRRPDGSRWGDRGRGYISYRYATNARQAGDFWVINAIPGGTARPPKPMPN